MARLITQFSCVQGIEIFEHLKKLSVEGTLESHLAELRKEAETSKKKARKLRQIDAILQIAVEKGFDYLERMLNNKDYVAFSIDEDGYLRGKFPRGSFRQQG